LAQRVKNNHAGVVMERVYKAYDQTDVHHSEGCCAVEVMADEAYDGRPISSLRKCSLFDGFGQVSQRLSIAELVRK
jgi:hypothetical protein